MDMRGPTYTSVLVIRSACLSFFLSYIYLFFSFLVALRAIGGRTSLSSFPMGTIPHGIYNNNGHERGRRVDLYLPVRFSFSSTFDRCPFSSHLVPSSSPFFTSSSFAFLRSFLHSIPLTPSYFFSLFVLIIPVRAEIIIGDVFTTFIFFFRSSFFTRKIFAGVYILLTRFPDISTMWLSRRHVGDRKLSIPHSRALPLQREC